MTRRKWLITILVVVVIAGVLLSAYYSDSPGSQTKTTTNHAAKGLTFDENALVNRGVTTGQLGNLELALGQYLNSQGRSSGRVDFNSIYRAPPDPKISTPFSEISFVVQLDGQPTYKAKLDSFSTSEIRLYLYTLDGNTLVYDSQSVGGSSDQ